MAELTTTIDFGEQQKSLLKQALKELESAGAQTEAKTAEFRKKWGPEVTEDVLPEKPKSAQSFIQVLQSIPGIQLDEKAKNTIEQSIFGSSQATAAELYETHTPGKASEDNTWIRAYISTGQLHLGKEDYFVVKLSRVVDLKGIEISLKFGKTDTIFQGGTIQEESYEPYPHKNIAIPRGSVTFDPQGNIKEGLSSLADFHGRVNLPQLLTNITTRENLQEAINPAKIIPLVR